MSDEVSVSPQNTTYDDLVAGTGIDRTTFAALYDRYSPQVLKYCMRRLLDRQTAEDVCSDVFLKVATQIRQVSFKTESDFRCWLFRIAMNTVAAHWRQSLRRKKLWEAASRSRHREADSGPRASSGDHDLFDWPTVYQALLELGEREQAIVTLRFFAGLSHEEIADVVQTTPGAVRTALSRALQSLREKFDLSVRPDRTTGRSTQG